MFALLIIIYTLFSHRKFYTFLNLLKTPAQVKDMLSIFDDLVSREVIF